MLLSKSPVLHSHELLAVTTPLTPYQTFEQGEVAGMNTQWVQSLLVEAELTAEFEIYPWARAMNIAKTQPNVLIYAIARMTEREDDFYWIARMAQFEQALISLNEQQDEVMYKIEQQQRISLALPRGHAANDFIKSLPFYAFIDVLYTATTDEAWQLLLNKRVDAVVENPQLMPAIVSALGLALGSLSVLETIPGSQQDVYLAASKGTDPEVVQRLQQANHTLFPAKH
ncbi:MAG: transporter substrate-binding domain-containing protein [Alkalimonas sp.]|nr:transporter substrate-binding domain-containing protein [Alkalimonas sp.]